MFYVAPHNFPNAYVSHALPLITAFLVTIGLNLAVT